MSTNPPPGRGDENEWDINESSRSQWPTNPASQPNTGWGFQQPNQAPPSQGQAGSQGQPGAQGQPGSQGQSWQLGSQGQPWAKDQQGAQGQPWAPGQQPTAGYAQYAADEQQYAQGYPYQQPQAARPKKRGGLIAIFAVVVIVLGVGIGWGAAKLFPNGNDDKTNVAASEEPKSEDASSADPSASPSGASEPTETEAALPDDPKKALDQIVKTDGKTVRSDLVGKWVPQLSSKKLGLEAEGKTWDEEAILEEHQELREEFPRVQLVWSGDFKSFKQNDFWVTIVGIGYDDPEQALSWCSSHGLGPDSCYAKQLNTTGDDEGTTRLQD